MYLFFFFAGLGVLWAVAMWYIMWILVERKWWNGGKCRLSGLDWKLISIDEYGHRIYSDGAYETITISFKSVDGWKK